MKKRVITSIIIVAVILGAFVVRYFAVVSPIYVFAFDGLILFISIMALIEVSNALVKSGKYEKPLMFFLVAHMLVSYLLIKIAPFSAIFAPTSRYSSYLYLSIEMPVLFIIMFVASFFTNKITLGRMVSTAFVMFYPTILLVFMLSINNIYPVHQDFIGDSSLIGFFGLAMLFAISFLSDTFAFLTGVTFKGPKLCPNLSPKKTISGAIGGIVGGFLGGMLIFALCRIPALSFFGFSSFAVIPFFHFAVMGVIGSIFTQVGDLAASYLKRACEIKDFSDAFPGHGGYMDRLDGLMFNSIFIYFYMLVFIIFIL